MRNDGVIVLEVGINYLDVTQFFRIDVHLRSMWWLSLLCVYSSGRKWSTFSISGEGRRASGCSWIQKDDGGVITRRDPQHRCIGVQR